MHLYVSVIISDKLEAFCTDLLFDLLTHLCMPFMFLTGYLLYMHCGKGTEYCKQRDVLLPYLP